jgi:hypothetical protein
MALQSILAQGKGYGGNEVSVNGIEDEQKAREYSLPA